MSAKEPKSGVPIVEVESREEYALFLARSRCESMLKLSEQLRGLAQEPARAADHNRSASLMAGLKGLNPPPLRSSDEVIMHIVANMSMALSEMAKTMAVMLNCQLLAQTGKGEMWTPKEIMALQAEASQNGGNAKT